MTFFSILFARSEYATGNKLPEKAAFYKDLCLDQIIEAITARKPEYDLKSFFYQPLHDSETIRFRHEVMRDLTDADIRISISTFTDQMILVRRYLALITKLNFEYHKKGWFLEAAVVYCNAVLELSRNLNRNELQSRGLLEFRTYVTAYIQSQEFQSLREDAHQVKDGLQGVKYCVILQDGKFKVKKYEGEIEYSSEVEEILARFKQGTVKQYLTKLPERRGVNHIEEKILEFVARLFPELFDSLRQFCNRHESFVAQTLHKFDCEIQFYIAYLEFIADIKTKGLKFCYPQLSASSHEVYVRDSFDLALANRLLATPDAVVCNDFFLQGSERIIVVTGPNQGGKTTFARQFGQMHYLASLGYPVPGTVARLFLFDQILTHFERAEDIHNLRGKLQDDLLRIHEVLSSATANSILILNEIFASTTLKDAVVLSEEIMTRVMAQDSLCVWVTFIDELSCLSEKTVSMVSTVDPENQAERTFKIIRMPTNGLAYALSLAEKHGLTYAQIKKRIPS